MKQQDGRDIYRQANKAAKKAVAVSRAKARAMNELYEEVETPEGERKISRIVKARDFTKNNQIKDVQRVVLRDLDRIVRRCKDFTKNNQIKDEQRVVLRDLDRIMGRWKGYFDKQLDGENHRFASEDGVPNDGLTQ